MKTNIFRKLFGWAVDEVYLDRLADRYGIMYQHYFDTCKELDWCVTDMKRAKTIELVEAPVRVRY